MTPVKTEDPPKNPRVQLPVGIEILNPNDYCRDSTVLSVVFTEEDHTMSNLLKHIIAPMPGVEFVGAGETHPLEGRMILHIQTISEEYLAADILVEGFKLIGQVFGGIQHDFMNAYKKFDK